MPGWIADYRVHQAGPGLFGEPNRPFRTWVDAPDRLGLGAERLVLHAVVQPDDDRWDGFVDDLRRWAALPGRYLVELVEVGVVEVTGTVGAARGTFPLAYAATRGPVRPESDGPDQHSTLRAVADAARGAHQLHGTGVVHGCIGPDRVLETGEGGCLDLPPYQPDGRPGLLFAVDDIPIDGLDPDRARGEAPTRASDTWALAASLHRMLTGTALHPGIDDDPPLVAVQRVAHEPPQLADSLADPARALLAACLGPDPRQRPTTADELAGRIDTLVRA